MKDIKLKEEELKLTCYSLNQEIKKSNPFLKHKDIHVFNTSFLPLKNSNNFLIASRGWYGNIRSWDGRNFIILSILNSDLKKIKQNILELPSNFKISNIVNEKFDLKYKYKEYYNTTGPEDPRLFYHTDGNIYILINDINTKYKEKKRHMFIAKVNLNNLTYDDKLCICEKLSTNFEKNWGSFTYKNDTYLLYDINPLTIYKIDDIKRGSCINILQSNNKYLSKFDDFFPDFKFHLRNSTNLLPFDIPGNPKKTTFLGLGHAVLDYKGNSSLNKYIFPSLERSNYSSYDKEYFKNFTKFYLGFFYILDMENKKIKKISPFFQLPNYESKQELIFFPTSIHMDNKNFINVSYNLGDNRSYLSKLHKNLIRLSLYDLEMIDFYQNYNINPNYYLELIRSIRKYNGFSVNVNKWFVFKNRGEVLRKSIPTVERKKKSIKKTKKNKKTKKK